MNALALLRALTPSSRPAQDALAEAVERFLASAAPMLCLDAEAGIGKTLAYGAPLVLAAQRGRRAVVSTHTTQQLGQVMATLRRAAAALPGRRVEVAARLGRANFLSCVRIARLLAAPCGLDAAQRAQLVGARDHGGLIDAFERDCGPLPVAHCDVCLTVSCAGQGAYRAQRLRAAQAAIVVQTHAMSVLDALRGEIGADIVVYDEADALPCAAAGFAEARVTPHALEAVASRHALPRLRAALAAFQAWAGGADAVVLKHDDAGALRHAEAIRAALAGADTEHARDLRRSLSRFIGLDASAPTRAAAVVATRAGPAFEVLALDPARVLRRTFATRKTVFASATLAPGTHDVLPFLRSVGAEDLEGETDSVRAEMATLGAMRFVLAAREAPLPFDAAGQRAPAFDDYAAHQVRSAMAEGGRVLVLAASFDDVDALAGRLPGLLAHRRGEALERRLQDFAAAPEGVLATPSAWAGTDLPGLLAHVVIVRLPFSPPHPGRERLLCRALAARGCGGLDARGMLHAQRRREALRRLAQGIGRGVRAREDRVTLWIADPRFPLPDALALSPRHRMGQGHAARHRDLSAAIPRRFREAFERVRICEWPAPRSPHPHGGG